MPIIEAMRHGSWTAADPIASLKLSRQAVKALDSIGITTVEDLSFKVRIRGLLQCSQQIRDEVNAATGALLRSGTGVDWNLYVELYSEALGLPLLPLRTLSEWSPARFVRELPAVVECAVTTQFGARHAVVLQRRMLSPKITWTHERTGRSLGVTRSRTSKMEKRMFLVLRRAFLFDDYRRCRFRLRPEFCEPLRLLARKLKCETGDTLTTSTWRSALRKTWNITVQETSPEARLILEILGLCLRE